MHIKHIAVPTLTITAGVAAALWLVRHDALTAPVVASPPHVPAADFATWSGALEKGATVQLVRRLCDTQKAQHVARTGTPAPDVVAAGEITTFGPIPDDEELRLARTLETIAQGTLEAAERLPADDLGDAREQIGQVIHGLKAREAARAVVEGRYWTIARNTHPRLPEGYTFWVAQTTRALADGRPIDVYVPLDLRSPELASTHQALLSLEKEVRRDHSDEFNRLAYEDRKDLAENAWRAARGEKFERDIPAWFWELDIDKSTWLASPTRVDR